MPSAEFASRPVIIEVALNGQTTKEVNPNIGLEDYMGGDKPTNEELVERAVDLCAEAGRPVASIEQTVEILGLPG